MLTLDEIGQSVRNNIQLVIDNYGLPLAVGPISDDDYKVLSGGFGDLEWDYVLSTHGNSPDRYEFCIKLLNQGVMEGVPSGAALCIFRVEEYVFSIHMIESFVKDDAEHPLKGRMVLITLMSAYLFCMAVECPTVRIVEPVPELHGFYEGFGFRLLPCGYVMEANTSDIEDVFNKFAQLS
ncbi:hypothetical protein [Buttiauxella sp. A111]|uniref:hypothetical protein n=1 Tax=Buttiauxella sp. A111 TaxID=2563088 RepID=UPI0010ED7BA3|nr:hypothetical protein [Buttiauxella sp. A111]GDX06661.1 hypothetical protein BSPA111_28730 [Buttiauxella sp. A111]